MEKDLAARKRKIAKKERGEERKEDNVRTQSVPSLSTNQPEHEDAGGDGVVIADRSYLFIKSKC